MHNEKWLAWLTTRNRGPGSQGDAERRQFPADPFPEGSGQDSKDADAFLTRRGLILRRVDAYGLSDALRLTVGNEEANGVVVGGLARLPEGGPDA